MAQSCIIVLHKWQLGQLLSLVEGDRALIADLQRAAADQRDELERRTATLLTLADSLAHVQRVASSMSADSMTHTLD